MSYKEIAEALKVKEKSLERYFQITPELQECNKRIRREATVNPGKFHLQGFSLRPETWSPEGFEAILERMRVQHRGLYDVCKGPDLPSYNALRRYMEEHPEFREKIDEIYHLLHS